MWSTYKQSFQFLHQQYSENQNQMLNLAFDFDFEQDGLNLLFFCGRSLISGGTGVPWAAPHPLYVCGQTMFMMLQNQNLILQHVFLLAQFDRLHFLGVVHSIFVWFWFSLLVWRSLVQRSCFVYKVIVYFQQKHSSNQQI
eukprot:TRINITY_DN6886_c0_g1_i1.p3 TRINITY_DN6886_c0_g1~~TRINITY_DN6886_c0_g1_i1.p3  ORF type:complete len:140 (+),score=12.16 TRINITY_DN6886_c0_g1_i1:333-752(+)